MQMSKMMIVDRDTKSITIMYLATKYNLCIPLITPFNKNYHNLKFKLCIFSRFLHLELILNALSELILLPNERVIHQMLMFVQEKMISFA